MSRNSGHDQHDETFVVIEGRYEVRLGDDIIEATPGDYVYVRGRAVTSGSLGIVSCRMYRFAGGLTADRHYQGPSDPPLQRI